MFYILIFLISVLTPGILGTEWLSFSVLLTERVAIKCAELAPLVVTSFSEVVPCDLAVSPVKGDAGKSRSP